MSTHRFKADPAFPGACAEAFGGVARCGLPMANGVHTPTDAPPDETVVAAPDEKIRAYWPEIPAEVSLWQKAVAALRTEGVGWHNGPWPFRKYVIRDDRSGGGSELFEQCLKMLVFSGIEFWVDCRRVEVNLEVTDRREAFVTYGRFCGVSREAVARELEEENET